MPYDFTTMLPREGQDAIAVEKIPIPGAQIRDGFSRIPMWVADMNFATLPAITESIIRRAQHPAFGYFQPRKEYFDAIIRWQAERNGVQGLTPEDIGYENGVLGGVITALRVLCSTGDSVLVHSPTYIGFTNVLKNNGYNIVASPLYQDDAGVWRMDYADMERKIQENHIHAAIFCSPHNPCGRVWTREELEQAMDVYRRNDVFVISDEIWSDLTLPGYKHIPTQSVNEDARTRTIAMYAPSKTFNLAGLVGSYHIVYNKALRDRINKEASLSHYNSMNVLWMHALMGAYTPEGETWVDELREVLGENVRYACDYIAEHFDGVSLARPEGTYMLFLDCSGWCAKHGKTLDELLCAGVGVGVVWQDGRPFHGECAIRMNLAVPTAVVKEAFDRLDKYVFNV
ncbi:MAG TPA: aminotransferase class I/II-fold pyridoxal phosphate-dependent enzyme [Candidatus Gemmiger faecavium]|nr:aminotransferase class I/II-fold pyridoxal phosphate-dependent enzyme [Candidatus Gemmiger faecavium]